MKGLRGHTRSTAVNSRQTDAREFTRRTFSMMPSKGHISKSACAFTCVLLIVSLFAFGLISRSGSSGHVLERRKREANALNETGDLKTIFCQLIGNVLALADSALTSVRTEARRGVHTEHSEQVQTRSDAEDIDHVINTGIRCRNIPGLAVAVVKDGQVVLSKGYGVKNLDRQDPVTSDTMFQIASTTKAFTGALLSNLVAGNSSLKISINVYKTLPKKLGFKFNNTIRSTYTTLEDLLAHRLGIPRNNYARLATDYSPRQFLKKIRYLQHVGGFRDSFYYNDIMYGLAAFITEQLGGKAWKQQIQDTIFAPLGMEHSTFADDVDFEFDDIATPYLREKGKMVKPSIDFIKHWGKNLGSGNIVSSVRDMSQWMLMLLNDGKSRNGRRVLRDGVVEEVFKPQNVYIPPSYSANYRKPVTPESFTVGSYSLGWRQGYYKGYKTNYHTGSTFGYRAQVTLLPDKKVGVVTLMTGSDYQYKFRTALHMYLMDHALGHAPWINSSSICSFPDPWRKAYSASRQKKSVASPTGVAADAAETEDEEEEDEEGEDGQAPGQSNRRVSRDVTRRSSPRLALHRYTGTFRHQAYGNLVVRLDKSTLILEYGVGRWRLEWAGRGHEFDGRWLKAPPTLDKSFRFRARGLNVYVVEGTGFEPAKPPAFYRQR